MAKAEWGTKRTCHSCGARFYDLHRETIVCPVCETVYDPDRQARTRRSVGAAREEAVLVSRVDDEVVKKKALESDEEDVDAKDPDEGDGDGEIDEIKSEDRDLIEDTSDLGEDDDDIGEVMEHLDEDVEDKT